MDIIKVFSPEEIVDGTCESWVLDNLEKGQKEANHRQRSRIATLDAAKAAAHVVALTHGEVDANGGGICKQYSFSGAKTTVVGVAWLTTQDGRRHVRVRAERIPAPYSAYAKKRPEVFSSDCVVASVYKHLAIRMEFKKYRTKKDSVRNALRDAVVQNNIAEADLRALIDHVQETGDQPEWFSRGFISDAEQYLGIKLDQPVVQVS